MSTSDNQSSPPPPPPGVALYSDKNARKVFRTNNLSAPPDADEEIRIVLGKKLWDTSGNNKIVSYYNQVHPVLQEGPMCGLVALSMASQLFVKDGLQADDVLRVAKAKGYTSKGEMFSAENMKHLAMNQLRCNALVLPCNLWNIIAWLSRDSPVLVPYDADFNHEPSLRKGHAAHWSVLTGLCLVFQRTTPRLDPAVYEQDPSHPNVYHCRKGTQVNRLVDGKRLPEGCRVHVYARHGKSAFLTVWDTCSLLESNANLTEIAPKHAMENFVLPFGGVKEGLCDKIVVLQR